MKKLFLVVSFCASIIFLQAQNVERTIFPVIKHYGAMFEVPNGIDKPDPTLKYNIIVEAGGKMEKADTIYNPLDHVARIYNLHIFGGVPKKNLDLEFIVFGPSVNIVLNNETYKKKFGVDNPNLGIIQEMKDAGIKLYACGQSIGFAGIDPATVNPNFEIVYSRATTVATRQLKGYAFFKF